MKVDDWWKNILETQNGAPPLCSYLFFKIQKKYLKVKKL
jgi:hypothetical protein